jgi:hypoxanthine phosphoribosyltransferase
MMERPTVVFDAAAIEKRVAELGAEITKAYAGQRVCIVGLMTSGLVFTADLMRNVELDLDCHVLRVTAVPDKDDGSLRTDIVYSGHIPYEHQNVIVICDVIDTGITLNFLMEHIRGRRPKSLRICTLLDKPDQRKIELRPDWVAFSLKEPLPGRGFLVGYGLDHEGHYRGLPYLGTISRSSAPEGLAAVSKR